MSATCQHSVDPLDEVVVGDDKVPYSDDDLISLCLVVGYLLDIRLLYANWIQIQ